MRRRQTTVSRRPGTTARHRARHPAERYGTFALRFGAVPLQVAGLQLWLAADAIPGLSDGQPVASWPDGSGLGRHAAQATAAKRPTYRVNIQNGRPGVQFDGIDDGLRVASLPLGTFALFLVFRLSGTAGIIVEHSADAGANDGHYLYGTTGMTINCRRQVGARVSGKNRAANWAVDNAAKLAAHAMDGTHAGHRLRINRVDQSMTSGPNTDDPLATTVTDELNVGCRNEAAEFSTGYYFELLAYSPCPSLADQQRLEDYLRDRWGTP